MVWSSSRRAGPWFSDEPAAAPIDGPTTANILRMVEGAGHDHLDPHLFVVLNDAPRSHEDDVEWFGGSSKSVTTTSTTERPWLMVQGGTLGILKPADLAVDSQEPFHQPQPSQALGLTLPPRCSRAPTR